MNTVKNKKKILLICGISQTVITFRLGLIKILQEKGFEVAVIALDDDYKDAIINYGIEFYNVNSKNRSLNPFGMRKLLMNYRSIIKQIQPDIVFTFMLKPNIFGVRAAKKEGVKRIFSMVEGAGDVFINNSFNWRIIRFVVCRMYKKSFNEVQNIFFLNQDDRSEFVARKVVKDEKTIIVSGIGVDIEHFAQKPIKNNNTFLMIARMLTTKGVIEYCQAAKKVKQKYPNTIFNYLGAEGSLSLSDIQEYLDSGVLNYLGTTSDVRPYLEDCSVYVLPSYREGMPMSTMEAESVGRAIITTNTNGCKDTVKDGYNGKIINVKNCDDLAGAMIWFLENPQEIERMGQNSREIAETKFAQEKINKDILSIITQDFIAKE